MQADIVTIGDEILIGQIVNTNASWIAQNLNQIGIKVNRIVTVGDSIEEILDILNEASKRSQLVLITGGLGPTSDDITKPALCQYFETGIRFDEKVFAMVDSFVKIRGGSMNVLNKAQANVPIVAQVIYNEIGTAPGLWFEKNNVVYISMPGVPFEMEAMMTKSILPKLKTQFKLTPIYHKTVLTTGIPESKLALTIEAWEKKLPDNISLAYLPSPGMLKLRLTAYEGENMIDKVNAEINSLKNIIGEAIYGYDTDTLENVIGLMLKAKQLTLSTAESCTGGNISKLITSVPGSSEYFKGSIVAYSNDIKTKFLKVPNETIKIHGAVSKDVVEIMAYECLQVMNSDYSISVSGIAGPDGGTVEKPIGTVWIAVASKNKCVSKMFNFGDVRGRNVIRASSTALNMLRIFILQEY
jgi:nicotinamide-nucleotide amidase